VVATTEGGGHQGRAGGAPDGEVQEARDLAEGRRQPVAACRTTRLAYVQSLACLDAWKIDPAIVNGWGGAIALGHPLGASGARIVGTLAHRMRATRERWGVAAICIGVGQGLAVVLENVEVESR
jgi:acetyl-CoA acyltransferase